MGEATTARGATTTRNTSATTRRSRGTTGNRGGITARLTQATRRRGHTTGHRTPTTLPANATMTIPADMPLLVRETTTTRVDQPPSKAALRLGGRPSRSAALALRARILSVATELFLTQGYGLTTIEAVARNAGVSKRTFYHRFADKAALFAAVIHHIVETIRPPPEVPLLEGATLHDILRRLARLILDAALSAPAIAIHRLIVAESARFPEVVRAANEQDGTAEAHALVGGLLAREFDDTALPPAARDFATQQFLQMVVAIPRRRAMGFGTPMSSAELDVWATQVVTLFLNGCRASSAAAGPRSEW